MATLVDYEGDVSSLSKGHLTAYSIVATENDFDRGYWDEKTERDCRPGQRVLGAV